MSNEKPGKLPGKSDGLKYEAHVMVEKWSPEQVADVKKKSGKAKPERQDFIKHGHEPIEITNDVEGA